MRQTIQSWAGKYLAIPYEDLGRDESGVDCWGGVCLVYAREFGIELPPMLEHYDDPKDPQATRVVVDNLTSSDDWREITQPEIGDVALMQLGRLPHVGVCCAAGKDPAVLHWSPRIGVAIERFSSASMSGSLRSWWRHRDSGHGNPTRIDGERPGQVLRQVTREWSATPQTVPMGVTSGAVPMPEGTTVLDMVRSIVGDGGLSRSTVTLNGLELDREAWGRIRPKAGAELGLMTIPAGGDGKNPFRTFLMLAVVAAAAFGPLAFGLQAGTAGFAFASGAIALGGGLLVNTLAPPPSLDFGDQPGQDFAPSITGGRNSARQYRAIPMNLGENRVVPALAALPYTESVGDDQYLRQLFVVSYGPQEIDEIKIGETPIENFEDVQVEIRRGFPDEEQITLYPGVVIEDQFQIDLDFYGPTSFTLNGTGNVVTVSFPGDLDADDEITMQAVGECDAIGGSYTTNAAGIVMAPTFNGFVAGDGPADGNGPNGTNVGACAIGIYGPGVDRRNFFSRIAANGLGDSTPTDDVTETVRLGDLFTDPEIDTLGSEFNLRVVDSSYGDNSGSFVCTISDGPGWVTRTSAENANELAVEITAPSGVGKFVGGQLQPIDLRCEVEYRAVGDTDWIAVNDDDGADQAQTLDDYFGGPNSTLFATRVSITDVDTPPISGDWPDPIYWDDSSNDIGATEDAPQLIRLAAPTGVGKNFALEYEADLHLTPEIATAFGLGSPPYSVQFAVDGVGPFELFVDDQLVVSKYTEDSPAGDSGGPDFSVHNSSAISFTTHRSDIRLRLRIVRTKSTTDGVNYGAIALGWKVAGVHSDFEVIPTRGTDQDDPHPLHFPGGSYPGSSQIYSGAIIRAYQISDPSSGNELAFYTASQTRVRRTLSWEVDQGQYEVRVRRTTPTISGNGVLQQLVWTALRTIRHEYPINKDCLAIIAVRIKASGQLNGVIDQLSCRARSIGLDYDETSDTWIQRITSNPASLFRMVLQGKANARMSEFTDAKIDLDQLEHWHNLNIDRGLEFNAVIEQRRTVFQILNAIASAGRGSFTMKDSLFSVVVDEEKTTPVQHLTPRNTRNLKGDKVFPKIPHALRVQFVNKDEGYQQDERIVLDDGYQFDGVDAFGDPGGALPEATRFESISFYGTTSPDEAWKHGRYHLAVMRLRPERMSVDMDIEHLACHRGDLVVLTHDVPLVGLGAARIVERETDGSGDLLKLYLDDEVTFGVGSYQLRIRREDGSTEIHPITVAAGTTSVVELTTPISPPQSGWPEVGSLVLIGEVDSESLEMLVDQIQPSGDLGAKVSLVPHSPDIHDADTGTIPPFDSGITQPPGDQDSPDDPSILTIASDSSVLSIGEDGTVIPKIVLSVGNTPSTAPPPVEYELLYRRQAGTGETSVAYSSLPSVAATDGVFTITGVTVGETYEIRVRGVDAEGRFSNYTDTTHTVVGWDLAPDALASFDLSELGDDTRRFSWAYSSDAANILGVEIRFGPSAALTWDDLIPLTSSILSVSPYDTDDPDAGTRKFGASVKDAQGNYSSATIIERTLGASPSGDTLTVVNARVEGWTGTLSQCWLNSENELEVNDTTDWDALASGSVTWDDYTRWNRSPQTTMSYVHQVDHGSEASLQVSVYARSRGGTRADEIRYAGTDLVFNDWADASTLENMPITARYVEVRSTITGDGSEVLVLEQQGIIVRS